MEPTISVIIPVYNPGIYLEESLNSVFNQTLQPLEIIAINDGSTDSSLEILERFSSKLVIVSRENKGLTTTLNEAIRLAKGSLLTFLDADDLWAPDKLATQLDFMTNNPEMDACFGMIRQFISPELPDEIKQTIMCPSEIQRGIMKITFIIKSEIFERIGCFDETLQRGDFIEWFARAQEAGIHYRVLPQLLAYRRLHRNSMSSRYEHNKDLINIAKAVMDRRRNAVKIQ